jgi:tetratricopeptide (TPR) repeat protein
VDVALQLGNLYARQGLKGEAAQQLATVVELHRRAGRHRDALRVLKQVVDLDGGNPRAYLNLARTLEHEKLNREAADAYRAAGQEWMRRGRPADGVEALKRAFELEPESRGILMALAEAHAAKGDVRPALDLVARALEQNPNNIDLIIILGRTFLNAGMLEKAEATFERLFRLDNSRYDYLLEVARAYVERGELERTMGIVDSCVEVMLARRHKKKATALLKAILEREPGNVHALKRLAAIYRNVRERRNLVNTLNTLVQAALDQGLRAEATVALRQLVEIEPKRKKWQEQLASIDGAEKGLALYEEPEERDPYDSYGDYSTELLEEMVAQHPEFLAARLKLLEELVAQQPAYVEGRLKLRQLYLDGGQPEKAAAQCLELARLYEERGDDEQAQYYRAEARIHTDEPDERDKPDLHEISGSSGSSV